MTKPPVVMPMVIGKTTEMKLGPKEKKLIITMIADGVWIATFDGKPIPATFNSAEEIGFLIDYLIENEYEIPDGKPVKKTRSPPKVGHDWSIILPTDSPQ